MKFSGVKEQITQKCMFRVPNKI